MFNSSATDQLLTELGIVATAADNFIAAKKSSNASYDFLSTVENVTEALENAVITSRNALERLWVDANIPKPFAPTLPYLNISGTVRVIEFNWLHIKLNTLLPHCHFQAPHYLSDTITRLLENFVASGGNIPRHDKAMLIIDEHCNIQSRSVYDQDNKGWKAVSNALKKRVFPDDDQFYLSVALVSTQSEKPSCNIFVIDALDAGNFFSTRSNGALYW